MLRVVESHICIPYCCFQVPLFLLFFLSFQSPFSYSSSIIYVRKLIFLKFSVIHFPSIFSMLCSFSYLAFYIVQVHAFLLSFYTSLHACFAFACFFQIFTIIIKSPLPSFPPSTFICCYCSAVLLFFFFMRSMLGLYTFIIAYYMRHILIYACLLLPFMLFTSIMFSHYCFHLLHYWFYCFLHIITYIR